MGKDETENKYISFPFAFLSSLINLEVVGLWYKMAIALKIMIMNIA